MIKKVCATAICVMLITLIGFAQLEGRDMAQTLSKKDYATLFDDR